MIVIIFIIAFFLIFRIASIANHPLPATNHWHHHFDNMNYSSVEFYKHIETFVSVEQIPGIKSYVVSYAEEGQFSMKRNYLRITRKRMIFDICAAPYGRGFFISWWQSRFLSPAEVLIAAIPFIGPNILKFQRSQTYFEIDTETMFKETIHECVLKAINNVTSEQGIRLASQSERSMLISAQL